MTDPARKAVLARIREGLEFRHPGRGLLEGPASSEPPGSTEGGGGPTSRAYRTVGSRTQREVLDLFADRVADYRATVVRTGRGQLPRVIARALENRGVRRLVIPAELPASWLESVPQESFELLKDGHEGRAFSKGQIASCHGVLTGCAVGVAETGTIVLDGGPTQGRRALTLLPDYHLCVVFGEQLVETVPEAVTDLSLGVAAHRRPLTLVSGPSATSDIELIRVEGVHGPRNLEVILVEENP